MRFEINANSFIFLVILENYNIGGYVTTKKQNQKYCINDGYLLPRCGICAAERKKKTHRPSANVSPHSCNTERKNNINL